MYGVNTLIQSLSKNDPQTTVTAVVHHVWVRAASSIDILSAEQEPGFVNLLRGPGIDSQPDNPI